MPLTMVNIGGQYEIKRTGGNEDTRKFLEKLGFTIGGIVTVVSGNNGNLIVNIRNSRVAIGRDMANRIIV